MVENLGHENQLVGSGPGDERLDASSNGVRTADHGPRERLLNLEFLAAPGGCPWKPSSAEEWEPACPGAG